MPRAFLYLYIVVVLSILIVGWGLDKAWRYYFITADEQTTDTSFLVGLEKSTFAIGLDRTSAVDDYYRQLEAELNIEILPLSLNDLANSQLLTEIKTGNSVTVYNEFDQKIVYKRLGDSENLLQVHYLTSQKAQLDIYYRLFLILFYSSIAVVVFIWLWPLTRDLKRLEKATQTLGEDGIPEKVDLPYSSTIYPLANAYNRSTQKIRDLIQSHEEMSYAMSHELRTPIARMKFALEILRDDLEILDDKNNNIKNDLDKELSNEMVGRFREDRYHLLENTRGLYSDVLQMDRLVSELLNYASFERKTVIDLKQGVLGPFLQQQLSRWQSFAQEQGANQTLVQDASSEAFLKKCVLICDWSLLERALANLIQNAFRYANSKVLLQVEPSKKLAINTSRHGFIEIRIIDDGPGIDEKDRDQVFEAFSRLRKQASDEGAGFGLGLAIVKRIMEWHGGSVDVTDAKKYSSLGGACFILRFPVS